MSTLAIVGAGLVGRSLLFNLTDQNFSFQKILLFDSNSFAFPCSLNSTAIVAPRGVTKGHSDLGDLICDGLKVFSTHVAQDRPEGVFSIKQFTGRVSKLDEFIKRYPSGDYVSKLDTLKLSHSAYFCEEEAFMVDPAIYLEWLLSQSLKSLPICRISAFVTEFLEVDAKVRLLTNEGKSYEVDHVVFASGANSRFWKSAYPESKLASSKPVQGAYLEFLNVTWRIPSFSLTFEGYNLVYRSHSQTLLVGNTSQETGHYMAPVAELDKIFDFFKSQLDLEFPAKESGRILVGIREKAQKRAPYVFTEGNVSFIGGLYKNGYNLSLKLTRDFIHQYLDNR